MFTIKTWQVCAVQLIDFKGIEEVVGIIRITCYDKMLDRY